MARIGGVTGVFLLVTWGLAAAAPVYQLDAACAHVLIDRSHEWLFAYDDLSEGILAEQGYQCVLSDAALDTRCKVADFDIVFVEQISTEIPFSDDEIALLQEYVRGGGRLILVGRADRPIARVVANFGLRMLREPGVPPLLTADWLIRDFGAEPRSESPRVAFTMEATPGAQVLVVDQNRTPVAVRTRFGKGEVLVFADDGSYWELCGRRRNRIGVGQAGYSVPDAGLTAALFRCLTPEFRRSKPAPIPGLRVYGERKVPSGPLTVRFSAPLARLAAASVAVLPRVGSFVQSANGGLLPCDTFVVHMLAGGGGGWASGPEVGVQCAGAPEGNIAVTAHEMTHCYEGALPAIFGEGWASLVGMRACVALGLPRGWDERASWERQFREADPSGRELDIVRAETEQQLIAPAEGKAMWMVEALESRYGRDFMVRFLELRHALKPKQPLNTNEVLHYLSLTAGQDLSDWYKSLGISYVPPTPIPAQELQARLEAHRQSLRGRQEDERLLLDYEADPEPFVGDQWRDEWAITASLLAGRPNWVDDPDSPPAHLRSVLIPDRGHRCGILIGHAVSPDKPFRMERTWEVPAAGQATLYLGVARRFCGGRSEVRIKVNGQPVWARVLDRDGWLHAPVDLAPYAGQRVVLALESDTRGEWGCREVLVDYLTLIAGADQ